MKICSKCLINKKEIEFMKDLSKVDGLYPSCKTCKKEQQRTIQGLISCIYGQQRRRSIRRGHKLPNYTNKELLEWILKQKHFIVLFRNWKISGYKKHLIPSCDRVNNNIGYKLNNIKLTTWFINNIKGHKYRKDGLGPQSKHVYKYNNKLILLNSYNSIAIAARINGINRVGISNNINGKTKSSGGYIWKTNLL